MVQNRYQKQGQKWNPIFFHIQCEKIFVKTIRDPLGSRTVQAGTSHFSLLARLGALLDRFQFFFSRPLDGSWARPGPVRVAPEASPEALGNILCE